MGMRLRSTAPESERVFQTAPDPVCCSYCGKPINPESLMDAAHDDCYEGKFDEPESLIELWAAECGPGDVDWDRGW